MADSIPYTQPPPPTDSDGDIDSENESPNDENQNQNQQGDDPNWPQNPTLFADLPPLPPPPPQLPIAALQALHIAPDQGDDHKAADDDNSLYPITARNEHRWIIPLAAARAFEYTNRLNEDPDADPNEPDPNRISIAEVDIDYDNLHISDWDQEVDDLLRAQYLNFIDPNLRPQDRDDLVVTVIRTVSIATFFDQVLTQQEEDVQFTAVFNILTVTVYTHTEWRRFINRPGGQNITTVRCGVTDPINDETQILEIE